MIPCILFRYSQGFEEELRIAKKHFVVKEQRTTIHANSLVIPRYSVLPYYKELQNDLEIMHSKLLNDFTEHLFVANLSWWYPILEKLTPRTWFQLHEIPDKGPFVLKGSTNSKKFEWNTHMYAETKKDAIQVHGRLMRDGLIGSQDIVIREYVPLKKLTQGFQGLPISEEYRFFILDGEILAGGFYWSSHTEDLPEKPDVSEVPSSFLQKVMKAIGDRIRFYVIDVARTASGEWIVIELNDAQMSGLSDVDPEVLYSNLKKQEL